MDTNEYKQYIGILGSLEDEYAKKLQVKNQQEISQLKAKNQQEINKLVSDNSILKDEISKYRMFLFFAVILLVVLFFQLFK